MLIIGLTGSIAMGKSTIATMFENQGIKTIGSDEIVHELYASTAVTLIEDAFPGSTKHGRVGRERLLKAILDEKDGFKKLEGLIHPLVREKQWQFIQNNKRQGAKIVVIDIPLLFETSSEKKFDAVILATAPADVQKQRVMQRPEMTEDKFAALLEKQMPDTEKRKKADHLINTDCSLKETNQMVKTILNALHNLEPKSYAIWLKEFKNETQ